MAHDEKNCRLMYHYVGIQYRWLQAKCTIGGCYRQLYQESERARREIMEGTLEEMRRRERR